MTQYKVHHFGFRSIFFASLRVTIPYSLRSIHLILILTLDDIGMDRRRQRQRGDVCVTASLGLFRSPLRQLAESFFISSESYRTTHRFTITLGPSTHDALLAAVLIYPGVARLLYIVEADDIKRDEKEELYKKAWAQTSRKISYPPQWPSAVLCCVIVSSRLHSNSTHPYTVYIVGEVYLVSLLYMFCLFFKV